MGLFNGYVDFDNQGSRFTGAYRLGGSVNVNNPLTIGDQLQLRAFATDEDMTFGRLAYLVPVGFWGTRLGASVTSFNYKLGEEFASLQSSGDGLVKSVYLFHPIFRTRNTQRHCAVRLRRQAPFRPRRRSDAGVDQGPVHRLAQGRRGRRLPRPFPRRRLERLLDHLYARRPEDRADAQFDQDQDPVTGLKTAGTFRKWNYDFKRLNRLTDNVSLLLALTGQQASKNLSSAEKMSLGGANGVRAYPVGEATGDNGKLIQGEVRYIWPGVKVFEGDVDRHRRSTTGARWT